jgi:hypothetical protein
MNGNDSYSITDGTDKGLFEFKDDTAKATGTLTYKIKQTTEADQTVVIIATDILLMVIPVVISLPT